MELIVVSLAKEPVVARLAVEFVITARADQGVPAVSAKEPIIVVAAVDEVVT
jgi:hypothetical protein